jgi:hypothetical protein
MAALLRRNCTAHRMGRHGLPNFLVPREGFASWRRDPLAPPAQTGSSISRRRRREITLRGESDGEARGPILLRQGRLCFNRSIQVPRHDGSVITAGSSLTVEPSAGMMTSPDPALQTCSNGIWSRSSPLQESTVPASRSWSATGSGRKR